MGAPNDDRSRRPDRRGRKAKEPARSRGAAAFAPAIVRRAPPPRPAQITFSWSFPLTLSHHCAWRCGYCPFPVSQDIHLPSISRVKAAIARARSLGLMQVRLVSGEGIESHPRILPTLRYYGCNSWAEYLQKVIGEMTRNSVVPPAFPELDVGFLSLAQMQQLRPSLFTIRLFLDSFDLAVQGGLAHANSMGKWPRRRLTGLIAAGKLGIPVTSGTMIGIGESPEGRAKALEILAELARRHGNIQSVILQPFTPQPGTPMADWPAPTTEELLQAVRRAREILPHNVAVQFPIMHCPERAADFVQAGADDLGDFDLTGDSQADSGVVQAFKTARGALEKLGLPLRDRLSLFPKFSDTRWVSPMYAKLLGELNRKHGMNCALASPGEGAPAQEPPSAHVSLLETRI